MSSVFFDSSNIIIFPDISVQNVTEIKQYIQTNNLTPKTKKIDHLRLNLVG